MNYEEDYPRGTVLGKTTEAQLTAQQDNFRKYSSKTATIALFKVANTYGRLTNIFH